MAQTQIQKIREELYEKIEGFKEGKFINKDQYHTLMKRFDKALETNKRNVYNDIGNKLNEMLANNLFEGLPKSKEEKVKEYAKRHKEKKQNEEIMENFLNTAEELGKENIPTKKSREERSTKDVETANDINIEVNEALNGAFIEISLTNIPKVKDFAINLIDFKNALSNSIIEAFKNEGKLLEREKNVNKFISIISTIIFSRYKEEKWEFITYTYKTDKAYLIHTEQQLKDYVKERVDEIRISKEEALAEGSGWNFDDIKSVILQIQKSKKTNAGSYIETPTVLASKRAIINVQNEDNKCILYALSAYKHHNDINSHHNKPYRYKNFIKEIKEPKGIKYPIDIQNDIKHFEKLNNIKINVLMYNDEDTKYNYQNLQIIYNDFNFKVDRKNICQLLLLKKGNKQHLVWIKDIDKLYRKESDCKRYRCPNCLSASFVDEEKLNKHYDLCSTNQAVHCKLPKEGSTSKFTNVQREFPHFVGVYCDFESTLVECNDEDNTNRTQMHIANSVAIKLVCQYDQFSKPIEYFNSNNPEEVVKFVVEKCEEYAEYSYKLSKNNEKVYKLTKEQDKKHKETVICEKCNGDFTDKNKKCIHHNHITGKYISSICSNCNLKLQIQKFMPVYFHNLKGYDSHLIITGLAKYGIKNEGTKEIINCIPNNEEKYISFSKTIPIDNYIDKTNVERNITYEIRFVDTLAFMNSSLDSLIENLKTDCKGKSIEEYRNVFKNVSNHYKDDKQFYLAISKGVYPYDYINKYERLNETKLPEQKDFYSKLMNEECSDKDYNTAKIVWKEFNCKTLLDYHNIYLISDVLLLADVFETFKKTCYKIYNLDPSYYLTSPSLSWDAFLKHKTDVYKKEGKGVFEIELLSDMDMYQFFERGIRGGLSQISKRYAKANNKYMTDYKPDLIDEYIVYLDANNLYGESLCRYLPKSNFKWNEKEWTKDKILSLGDEDDKGYTYEVDILYPKDEKKRKELHDYFNGYAPAPENICIKKEMLNSFQQERFSNGTTTRLCTTLNDKIKYVVNYRVLKLYLQLGLELGKVHRCIEYNQEPYMKSYIMKNTEERTKATNDFEKDFYKLMNNAIFGKSLENVRNRIEFRLVTSEKSALAITSTRVKFTIFNNDLVGVHLKKKEVNLCKPIFIGQTVLDDSKRLMFNFHYNFMLKKFKREDIDLLFTDTDSLCYHIKNQDPFQVMKENEDEFDLSNYNKDHFLYNKKNNKVIGKFKHDIVDSKTTQILEFVGLRSKMYAYETDANKTGKRCKGTKKCVVDKELNFEDYKNVLFNHQIIKRDQNGFRTHKHQIYTEKINKIALSYDDCKVYICDNNIDTYTHGHYKINL